LKSASERRLSNAEQEAESLPVAAAAAVAPHDLPGSPALPPDSSPEERIKQYWFSIRRFLTSLAQSAGLPSASPRRPLASISWLEHKNVIDSQTARIIRDLKHLRDMTDRHVIPIDEEQAERFEEVALRTLAALQAAKV
jgi:hypothetical protein